MLLIIGTDGRIKIIGYWKNGLRVMDGRLKALGCRLLVTGYSCDIMMFEMWMKGGNIKS